MVRTSWTRGVATPVVACGMLPSHGENGAERYLINADRQGGSVELDIAAFCRPRDPLAGWAAN